MPRRDATAEALDALREVDPATPDGEALVARCLRSRSCHVVARAAELVGQHRLRGQEGALVAALDRFYPDPVKRDPGCVAKRAALVALDALDHPDPEPFLRAARHVQKEPAWGPPVDTAAGLRGRAAEALARMGWPDVLSLLADLLADPEAEARAAAARAVAGAGSLGGAPLLRLKLHLGDREPDVTAACMDALLALDPAGAAELLGARLHGDDAEQRELAALALGASRLDAAVPLLRDLLDRSVLSTDRRVALTALAVHRSEAARACLLERVVDASVRDAVEVVRALSVQRFDPRAAAELREAVGRRRSGRRELLRVVDEVFGDDA